MKCYKHNSVDAVSSCVSCNKGLCTECSSIVDLPVCLDCALENNKKIERGIKFRIIGSGICFLLPVVATIYNGFSGQPVDILGAFSFGFWNVLFFLGISVYKHIPFFVVIMAPRHIIFGIILLIFAAPFIGMFYAPYWFYKMYRDMKKIKGLQDVSIIVKDHQRDDSDNDFKFENRVNLN